MRISFLGHAGFVVETAGAVVVMDPWLSERGAFDSGWMQFPCNHHLAPQVRELLENSPKQRFLYISHEHKDHFDPDFLATLAKRDFTVVIPRFRRAELRDVFERYGPQRVIACEDMHEVPIPGGYLKLFLSESGTNRDSAVLVRADGQCFLNLNDCKIHDKLGRIVEEEGPVDVFTAQFSGAIWHPTCYAYPREVYADISRRKRESKFEAVARALDTVRPRVFLASAGPACFLDPELYALNFESVNIFPRAPELFSFLDQRLPGLQTRYYEPMPGDVLDAGRGELVEQASERVTDDNLETYLRQYAARMAPLFRTRRRNLMVREAEQVHERLRVELQRKLDVLDLSERVALPLYVEVKEVAGRLLRVDFAQRRVEEAPAIREEQRYTLTVSAVDIGRVLDRKLTWEDFLLSFRLKLSRTPDVYDPIVHGFLGLELEDVRDFCEGVRATEARRERTVVTAGGQRYSVQRFCPHQGADLAEGWVEEDRYLVCPRHRWRFDLHEGGRCALNGATLCAEREKASKASPAPECASPQPG